MQYHIQNSLGNVIKKHALWIDNNTIPCLGHWLALNIRKEVVNYKTLKENSEVFYWWRLICHCRGELEHRQIQNLVDVLQSEGLLPVVKVVCDWMKCNREVILTCAQVCLHASTCITCIIFFFQTCVILLSVENVIIYLQESTIWLTKHDTWCSGTFVQIW